MKGAVLQRLEKMVRGCDLPGVRDAGNANLPFRILGAEALFAIEAGQIEGALGEPARTRRFLMELGGICTDRPSPDWITLYLECDGGGVRDFGCELEWGDDANMEPKVVEPKKDGTAREQAEWRKEHLNPAWYRREYRAQFSDSAYAYFDPERVKLCFAGDLKEQQRFTPGVAYRIHCDPGRVNDYFSIMIAHAEDGLLVEDKAIVLRPEDAPGHTLNYQEIEGQLISLLSAFRPVSVTFDQYNSAYLIDSLRSAASRLNLDCEVGEETATHVKNQDMFENLKLLINEGKVRCYRDGLNIMEKDRCLLEASLCKVEDVNGKIVKPRETGYGHLDLVDCLAVLGMQFADDLAGTGEDWTEGMTDMGISEW